jgi:hypothetical protein
MGEGAPGDPIWFTKGPHRINPSAMVGDLWAGRITDAVWQEMVFDAGIAALPLGTMELATERG